MPDASTSKSSIDWYNLSMGNLTVAVGLSGGVDSAVAALKLKESGYEVLGLTMKTWDGRLAIRDEGRSGCYGPGEARDLESAARAAQRLGIPHFAVDVASQFSSAVLDYFRCEYLAGRTPNPCVRCNQRVKFGALLRSARADGIRFDLFATGHYARLRRREADGRILLQRAADRRKDQSYFLAGLSQRQLERMLLPLGELVKGEVKDLARKAGWRDLADRPESQNFIENRGYGVLFAPEDDLPGPILDLSGAVIGEHRGIAHYTVGQRRKTGLGGGRSALYVVRLDARANAVVVGPKRALLAGSFVATGVRWAADGPPSESGRRFAVQVRYQHRPAQALVKPKAWGRDAEVVFDEPQAAVAPGQTAVFYDGDAVFGSGTIT
ncbi:MAG: tRNA 2-thiouridine(34) synthase MnmA [Elusimicrobia bacterium]|nr:tRNA 2-thiouridine(34) synthase MnmA [Elusimicrobiota bacterium]